MKSTRRGSDSPVHRREKTPRFQIPLDKWPVSPGTPREASGVPCLNPRRGRLAIVETLDLGFENETLFIVMEYIAGPPLSRIIREIKKSDRFLAPEIIAYT